MSRSATSKLPPPYAPALLEDARVRVRMEPLDLGRHWEGLLAIGTDPELWRWTISMCDTPEKLRGYLDTALRELEDGRSIPFATIDGDSGRVAGCTRFSNLDAEHRRVEIGWTWVGAAYQRSHINTGAKYLMMRHAFETWGCVRVELKTNFLNSKSRNAMLRIGCVEEGTLRKHDVNDRGVWRDTIYYSVLDTEWPAVKQRLEEIMAR